MNIPSNFFKFKRKIPDVYEYYLLDKLIIKEEYEYIKIDINETIEDVEIYDEDIDINENIQEYNTIKDKYREKICEVYYCNDCDLEFCNILFYEAHFQISHKLKCEVCKDVFINNKILDIHFRESHDPFFNLQIEKDVENV
jgi:hypothetical protein